jgi:hypothetical protein
MAEAGEGDGNVALGAPDTNIELSALEQKFASRCGEAKQKLAEADGLHAASA